jgi:nucleoid DNA-binding protein
MKLYKRELARDLANELGISLHEALDIYGVVIERLGDFIVEGHEIHLTKLGTFKQKKVYPRYFYDINTNERKVSEARIGYKFVASDTLVKRMNKK